MKLIVFRKYDEYKLFMNLRRNKKIQQLSRLDVTPSKEKEKN